MQLASLSPSTQRLSDSNGSESFDDLVLQYIKENRPEGNLDDLLKALKALVPDEKVSLQQITNALANADSTLRKDPEWQDYTDATLDKQTSLVLSLNMLFFSLLSKMGTNSDEENGL